MKLSSPEYLLERANGDPIVAIAEAQREALQIAAITAGSGFRTHDSSLAKAGAYCAAAIQELAPHK